MHVTESMVAPPLRILALDDRVSKILASLKVTVESRAKAVQNELKKRALGFGAPICQHLE